MEARRRSGESSSGSSSKGLRFAEEQLARHGWRRGQGLGKRENGISEALKVKVKCGTAGVGHNSAEQFTFHWWDHLFNASAANIAVEAGQDGVKVKQVSGQDSAITNQKPRKAQGAKNMLYGRFVKAATLTASGEELLEPPSCSGSSSSSSSSEEDEDEKLDLSTARRLTDEELVRACGGRTAHKGARHGLMMSAKLARLEEQEKAFLASRSRQEEEEELEQLASASEKGRLAGRRKEAKKQKQQQCHAERGGLEAGLGEGARKKRKRKQQQQQEEELLGESAELPDPRTDRGSCGGKRRKAKRKQRKAE
ncbi:G patch domain-containing protein 4 [Hemicordylus capensis]|uniref:G patch domain-containing protein 4 n=1 Tax=Hemicordylus capensis TaxID=884348 RepID=UPI0023031D22|nr:G patch domain-containing protein 4 [Hemicordylus capensis]